MNSINEIADIVSNISIKGIREPNDFKKPLGDGSDSDNIQLREVPDWEPDVSLEMRLERIYDRTHEKLAKTGCVISRRRNPHTLGSFQYQNPQFDAKTI